MKLSPNFTLDELLITRHKSLQSQPNCDQLCNLLRLCALVLQPLRDTLQRPVVITSGFRSPALNERVGGVRNSRHLHGAAADIRVSSLADARQKFYILKDNPEVDAVLFEHSKAGASWLHVQITVGGAKPRRHADFNYIV